VNFDQSVFVSKDLLATEMYQLISKEAEIAKYIAQLISIRKEYHESALQLLQSMETELRVDLSKYYSLKLIATYFLGVVKMIFC